MNSRNLPLPLQYGKVGFAIAILLLYSCVLSNDVQKEECSSEATSSLMRDVLSPYQEKLWKEANIALERYVECRAENCSCYFDTLGNDLKPYKDGISKKDIEGVQSKGTKYLIYKNKLYREKNCAFQARCAGVEHFLKELLSKLPDVEFVLNSRDWPQISRHFGGRGPVFSFSKTNEYLDIHYPAWSFWEGGPAIKSYPRGLGRWDLISKRLLEESAKWSWEQKERKGFFRGSRTSEERDPLVLLSRSRPTMVDAQYTKNQAWKSSADTLHAQPAEEVSLENHCRYKYLFNFRGVAASFRYKHLFLCGSTVIHFGDEWTEFFYGSLKPWIHYVPMAADSTQEEIVSLLEFLQRHDDIAKDIAHRGQTFIKAHLRMKDVKCYWRNLLRKYSKLLNYSISPDPNLLEIT